MHWTGVEYEVLPEWPRTRPNITITPPGSSVNWVKQGIAVWLWSIVIAIVVAILAAVGGSRFNILARLNGLPRLPINEGPLTVVGIIAALVAFAAALVGAILGGLAAMRYHRKIDRISSER
ncbi:hypothetical protein QRX50_35600 [Amycolatopsis carbonis]|uniref:Uncharacterized protein n=1 Tax=Amycolatopsis carbonis TaxID=715471 RepID=A0A9Y2MSK7_9PSEU|nr:hypothetical protein [Amycolatopsis sp. 2-15]WIX76736.1 hypothetical protein QRX50_35600 [Amycolatopsis sp. 2-15]